MAFSTFFKDPKVANQIGGLLAVLPLALFLQLTQVTDDSKYIIYVFFWLPLVPFCTMLLKLSSGQPTPGIPKLFDVDFIPTWLCWAALTVDIILWTILYFYFESVMPNEYGIQKPYCFCLKKSKNTKTS